MTRTKKIKLATILTLVLFLTLSVFGLLISDKATVNASTGSTVKTAADLDLPSSVMTYDTFASGVDLTEDKGFVMDKGAYVRVNKDTPGIRFKAFLGDSIDQVKALSAYEGYSFDYYIMFSIPYNGETKVGFVEAELNDISGGYEFTASLTFENLGDKFAEYKALEITGGAVIRGTKTGADTIVVEATASDNTRTMESVVNTGILQNAFEDYTADTQEVMNTFVPGCDDVRYNLKGGLCLERTSSEDDDGALSYDEISALLGGNVGATYFDTAKFDQTAFTLANLQGYKDDNDATGMLQSLYLSKYLTVKDKDGNFINFNKIKIADYVIREDSDLAKLADNSAHSGYWVVENDIVYNATTYAYHRTQTGDIFKGTFDGLGHTIEFAVGATTSGGTTPTYGLFNQIGVNNDLENAGQNFAIIKNAMFIVKGFEATGNAAGKYSILAQKTTSSGKQRAYLENVYGKYDNGTETFALNLAEAVGNELNRNNLAFISGAASVVAYTNCILDISKVTLDASGTGDLCFMPVMTQYYANYTSTVNNINLYRTRSASTVGLVMIASSALEEKAKTGSGIKGLDNVFGFRKRASAGTYNIAVFAQNDKASYDTYLTEQGTNMKLTAVIDGVGGCVASTTTNTYIKTAIYMKTVFRYDDYASMATNMVADMVNDDNAAMNDVSNGKLGEFAISESGITWAAFQD